MSGFGGALFAHLNTKSRAEECRKDADALEDLESEVEFANLQIGAEETVSIPPAVYIQLDNNLDITLLNADRLTQTRA